MPDVVICDRAPGKNAYLLTMSILTERLAGEGRFQSDAGTVAPTTQGSKNTHTRIPSCWHAKSGRNNSWADAVAAAFQSMLARGTRLDRGHADEPALQ
eukprot:58136-Chlamydomonas_euryale.AAC.4